MNKKFFTLFAGIAILFSAFTVNAQVQLATAADYANGKYVYLKTTANDFISVYGLKADSLVVKTLPGNASRAAIDSALWKVTENRVGDVYLYTFTNKKTGTVLSLPQTQTATPNMSIVANGVSQWAVNTAGNISSTFRVANAPKILYLGIASGLTLVDTNTAAAQFATGVPAITPLKAADLGDGFTVFTLSFGEAYSENIFDGVEVVASDLTGADAGFVKLQKVGAEKIGNANAFYGLDTTYYTIDNRKNVQGYKFVLDTVYTVDANHSVANDDFQKFYFELNPATDKVTMTVKDAPLFNNGTGKFESASTSLLSDALPAGEKIQVVYMQVLNSKVLSVAYTESSGAALERGTAPSISLTKGTPATLPGGPGVYAIKVKSGDKWKYVYATGASPAFESKDAAPKAYQPTGQWYIVEKDGKYQIVERNYNMAFTSAPAQVYKVTGSDAYRVDFVDPVISTIATEYVFEKLEGVEAGGKDYRYMATKQMTKEEMANFAYTLNLQSKTIGIEDLYTFIDTDNNLIIKGQTTAEEATKFKAVEANAGKVYTGIGDEHKLGVGAISLGDTLATATYYLNRQYTNNFVYVQNLYPNNSLVLSATNKSEFKFETADVDKYLLSVVGFSSNNVVLNVDNGKLVDLASAANPNYFNLAVEAAPNYADLGDGGFKLLTSSEGDSKGLIKNPANEFALVNAIVEPDSLYAFYVDTAYSKDPTKKLYYVTTQWNLTEAEKEAGIRNYMINPFYLDSAYVDGLSGYDALAADGKYTESLYNQSKVIFLKGIVEGDDTLKILGSNFGANGVDIVYKNMAVNPAAIAFATTENGFLRMENTVEYRYGGLSATPQKWSTERYYVQVINNVPYWSVAMASGHEFKVTGTDLFPTANENPEAGFEVFTTDGAIVIKGAAGAVANITNVLGQTVAAATVESDYETISAPKGIVFVTINGETVKAYVK